MTTHPVRKVRCPQCGGESLWAPENRWRPFCSERCKMVDLGAWLLGHYRVPAEEGDDDAPPAPGPADDDDPPR